MTAVATTQLHDQPGITWELGYDPKVARDQPNGQAAFHQARYDERLRLVYAGTGAGKTYAGAAEAIVISLAHPGSVGLAAEPDFPMVDKAMLPAFTEHFLIPEDEWGQLPFIKTWNRSKYRLDFTNGSRIWFISLDDPEKAEGPTVNWWWIDEARLVRNLNGALDALTSRARKDGYQGGWITTHSPTKELIDLAEPLYDDDGNFIRPGSPVYRWGTRQAFDAGVISEGYYKDMIARHRGARADARLEGLFARPEGLVYQEFNPARHIVPSPDPPKPDRPDDYEPWTQYMSYGVDWGYTHATCITAWAWHGNVAHGVDEWYETLRTIRDYIQAARDLVDKWGDGVFWCGPDKPGNIDQFRDAGLDARPVPPERRKVKDGTDHCNDRFAGDELLISPRMKHTLEEIDLYAQDPDKDEPEKDAPDAMDSLRYGVYSSVSDARLSMASVSRR